ncbi:anhydro-N-acetylmuramic acid kinase [Cyanobacterium sp. HL-69]|uniref:anhydro-N-acetylmuramic acid kinase n=1 Tax=Cyanobacterium sp. HL-69 TaxID=2054282 RepID=UPI00406BBBC2
MIVVGLMSGTSVDGIDAVAVDIEGEGLDLDVRLLAGQTFPYPDDLRSQILSVCEGASISMEELARLDGAIASCFADATINVIPESVKVELIGSHGQTVFHQPAHNHHLGYSLQLGRGDLIAHLTNIKTVNNFRQADIAMGGHGAPLVSKIDLCLFSHPKHHRCLQNIGGIGNVTYLPPTHQPQWQDFIMGWDTGPGNALIDLAVQKFTNNQKTYDFNGEWSRQGKPCMPLVKTWLKQDFFGQKPPKSTGRELFGHLYLEKCCHDAQSFELSEADFLATLTELTAASIAYNYDKFLPQLPHDLILGGGGSSNGYLKERLQANLPTVNLLTTDDFNVSTEFKEAIAFAILAYWRVNSFAGNLPVVTGAKKETLLGEIHHPCP